MNYMVLKKLFNIDPNQYICKLKTFPSTAKMSIIKSTKIAGSHITVSLF